MHRVEIGEVTVFQRSVLLVGVIAVALLGWGCEGSIAGYLETAQNRSLHSHGAPSAADDYEHAFQSSAGHVYYVATEGDDDHDGSEVSPWRTVQHAVDSIAPGDTVTVLPGLYDGARIERSGTPQAWKTLTSDPANRPVLTRPGASNKHDSNLEIETWEGAGTVSYWVIDNLEIRDAPQWGVDMRGSESAKSHHIVVRSNLVHHNGLDTGKTGIFSAFVDDLVVEVNESHSNGEHGIYVSNSGDRFVVRGNRAHANVGCGIHLNGDVNMSGDGILSDGVVQGNILYENGTGGGAAINMDGVTDTLVVSNLLYANHASGIALFQGDGAVCSQHNQVLQNTVVMPWDGRWALTLGGSGCVHNRILNNILYSDHDWRGSISLPVQHIEGLESDFNVLVDRLTTDDGESVMSLVEWRALGQDSHSLLASADELFADPSAVDFHLRAGCPAIDAGTILAGVDRDLEGRPRPSGGGYNIGAFELQVDSRALLPYLLRVSF